MPGIGFFVPRPTHACEHIFSFCEFFIFLVLKRALCEVLQELKMTHEALTKKKSIKTVSGFNRRASVFSIKH